MFLQREAGVQTMAAASARSPDPHGESPPDPLRSASGLGQDKLIQFQPLGRFSWLELEIDHSGELDLLDGHGQYLSLVGATDTGVSQDSPATIPHKDQASA